MFFGWLLGRLAFWKKAVPQNGLPAEEPDHEPAELARTRKLTRSIEGKTQMCESEIESRLAEEGTQE